MTRFSATTRICLSLVSLSISLLLIASTLGFFPNRRADVMHSRMRLCESMALSFSAMAPHTDVQTMQRYFASVAERNPDVLSIGLRKAEGILLLVVGDHEHEWSPADDDRSSETQLVVPIDAGQRRWGSVEVAFRPVDPPGFVGWLRRPELALTTYLACAMFVTYYIYLRRALRQLNPSKVIPPRVREAFDSLAEGILVLDTQEHVILANRSFEQATGRSTAQLMGRPIGELPFVCRDETPQDVHPWRETIQQRSLVTGRLLGLENDAKTFSVSTAPILDEKGANRGVLTSFEDVTQLRNKKEELRQLVYHLHKSSKEIQRQNQELEQLANLDPLTGCRNRRSFFEQFENLWKSSRRYGTPLSAIMVDIDHFKSINDTHGHAVGDEVLQQVGATLRSIVREPDLLCRYGGEEFAVLLPHTDIDQADIAGERLRLAISEIRFPKLSITASIGVSALSESPADPQELLDQADKCLYVAKRNGRNQVVRWDDVPAEADRPQPAAAAVERELPASDASLIPYHAVTALVSALAFRDQSTAAHSRRVADLCVAVAEGFLPLKDCYTLEMAALLHDIGKIGVPDAILLKPEALTDEEWAVMRTNTRMGAEIIHASFASPELSELVRTYHTRFEDLSKPGAPQGGRVLVGARILAIADAYDSMTTDSAYRRGTSHDEAVKELRRNAGTQFDPELVERFVRVARLQQQNEAIRTTEQSAEIALNIGVQIERLVFALDEQNLDDMRILAERLGKTATKFGAGQIACKASELDAALETKDDLFLVMQTAAELLDLCRATQRALLDRPRSVDRRLGGPPAREAAVPTR